MVSVDRPMDARKPHHQLVAQPVERVVGPRGRDGRDGQIRPAWELRCEQAVHQRNVALDFIGAHFSRRHRHLGFQTPVGVLPRRPTVMFASVHQVQRVSI